MERSGMKVAFVVVAFPVLSETFILNQITGLIDRGHEVDIFASEKGDVEKVHPDVIRYGLLDRTTYLPAIPENWVLRVVQGIGLLMQRLVQDPVLALRSINLFRYGKEALSLWLLYTALPQFHTQYDVIHCQFGTVSFRGMAFRTLHSPQAKLVTTFRGHDISCFVQELGAQVYDRLFATGDFFLTNCEFFRQRAIALGCPPHRIQVHFSGLDCSKFTLLPRSPRADGRVQLTTTGRLVEKKGIEYVIRAVARLLPQYPQLHYGIIGDGPLRPSLQALIDALGVGDRVQLLGWKNEQEIIALLNQTQIFVAPSVTAQDGNQDAPINVLKEAMALGLPVVSTYHGGIPELVQDGISGFLVPERDVDALVDKLGVLLAQPHRWSAMGQAGRAYVETHFDLHPLNDELVRVYQRLLTPTFEALPPLSSTPVQSQV